MADDTKQNRDAPKVVAVALRAAGIELHEAIGSGSSGTVYRATLAAPAHDLPAGAEVAVKVLHAELADDRHAIEQLEREAELGQRVRNPHVARIFGAGRADARSPDDGTIDARSPDDGTIDAGSPDDGTIDVRSPDDGTIDAGSHDDGTIDAGPHDDGTIDDGAPPLTYLVMQLVRGQSLRRFLADSGAVVEDFTRRIGLDAARGLGALHRLGVVHRDLKPENLTLTPDGDVVVVDLGLARRAGAPGPPSSGGFFGSLAYAAPEVLAGQRATARSDLYALGLVLFELVTGRHPFADARNPDEMMQSHLDREPPRPSHLEPRASAFLDRLIGDLLAKDPAARIGRAADVAAALQGGEASRYWRRHQDEAPVLASRQRLRSIRRAAPTRFVGRRAQRRALDRVLRGVVAGRGDAIQITGPRGIGRRRLLDEALEGWLRNRDDVVFLGGQARPGTAPAHGAPFPAMLLDWFLRGDAADSPHARARLAARIQTETTLSATEAEQLAGMVCGVDPGDSAPTRADLLARGLLELARPDRLLVLRVDRADVLSPTGQLVVGRLLDQLENARVLLAVVTPAGRPLPGFASRTIELEALPRDEFLRFGGLLFDPDAAPTKALSNALSNAHEALGGSPGNLLEALDDLAQQRRLYGRPGHYRDLDTAEIRPPGPVLARLRARVRALAANHSFVLKAAAVLGESCALDQLRALTGQNELDVLEALSLLDEVIGAERGRAAFRHRDYRSTLLDLIPITSRQRLHRAAAWILEADGAASLDVGLHLSRAAQHEASLEPLLLGIEELTRAGSARAAVRVAERLAVHFEALPVSPKRQAQLLRFLLLSGRAHRRAGDIERADSAYREAYRLARDLDQSGARGEALIGLARLATHQGQLLAALHLADRAVQAATGADDKSTDDKSTDDKSTDDRVAARALTLHAGLLGDLGHTDDALASARLALERMPSDDIAARAHLRVDLAALEALRTHFVAALNNLDRAAMRFNSRSDTRGLLRVQLERGAVHHQLGDFAAVRSNLEAARTRAMQLGDTAGMARAALGLGELAARRGDRKAARTLFADALTTATAARDRAGKARAGLCLEWSGVRCQGLEADIRTLDLPAVRAEWLLLEAARDRGRGRVDEAARRLAEAAAFETGLQLPLDLRLRILHATGRGGRANQLAEEVAARLPAGSQRRQFAAQARRAAALEPPPGG